MDESMDERAPYNLHILRESGPLSSSRGARPEMDDHGRSTPRPYCKLPCRDYSDDEGPALPIATASQFIRALRTLTLYASTLLPKILGTSRMTWRRKRSYHLGVLAWLFYFFFFIFRAPKGAVKHVGPVFTSIKKSKVTGAGRMWCRVARYDLAPNKPSFY